MTTATAALFLALSFTADEMGTSAALRAGAQERVIQRPAIRWGIKAAVIPLYLHEQKRHGWVRYGAPVLFLAAGAWNLHQAHSCNQARTRGGHCG